MSAPKQLNIGLIGAGIVGGGVATNLTRNADLLADRLGIRLNLKWVCDTDAAKLKSLPVPASVLCRDAQSVINDPDLHVIVELVGGTGFAKTVILDALNRHKVVVTANKALLAHHGEEIFAAAAKNGVNIFYEASVCGGIPIIKALREGFVAKIEAMVVPEQEQVKARLRERGGTSRRHAELEALPRVGIAPDRDRRFEVRDSHIRFPQEIEDSALEERRQSGLSLREEGPLGLSDLDVARHRQD